MNTDLQNPLSTNDTAGTARTRKLRLIPILSALGGAILLLRAVLPADAAPTPCKGAATSPGQVQCSLVAKRGL